MRSVVLFCPWLGRDISGLLAAVPGALVHEGVRSAPGVDGCIESHHQIVQEAADAGASRVFVMEDDCAFTPAFSLDRWTADADWAEAHGYGAMTGACVLTWEPRMVRAGLVEVRQFCSAHCIVYFASAYEAVLRTISPHDKSLADVGVRSLVTVPFVAVQRPGYSGLLGKAVDYTDMYHRHERWLGNFAGRSL